MYRTCPVSGTVGPRPPNPRYHLMLANAQAVRRHHRREQTVADPAHLKRLRGAKRSFGKAGKGVPEVGARGALPPHLKLIRQEHRRRIQLGLFQCSSGLGQPSALPTVPFRTLGQFDAMAGLSMKGVVIWGLNDVNVKLDPPRLVTRTGVKPWVPMLPR